MDNSEILKHVKRKLNSIICQCWMELREERNVHERMRLRSLQDQAKLLLYMINNSDDIFGEDNNV